MTLLRCVVASLLPFLIGLMVTLEVRAQSAPAAPPLPAESVIRRALGDRLPGLGKIDEVSRAPIPGLYEVRVGTDLFYVDAEGNFLITGYILDTRARRNLTEERVEKLLAIDFESLPLQDAFTIVRGNGKRRIAVFEDPNCGYCKRFERDLQKVDNVTIHMFLYPILGPSSDQRSKHIWCAKDRGRAWQDWMIRDVLPKVDTSCDLGAIARNVELGRRHKVTGTPTIFFADGSRVPGAVPATEIEKKLATLK